ncbi:hypothetical protein HK101_001070, partial [Irineochytrium annulatum]
MNFSLSANGVPPIALLNAATTSNFSVAASTNFFQFTVPNITDNALNESFILTASFFTSSDTTVVTWLDPVVDIFVVQPYPGISCNRNDKVNNSVALHYILPPILIPLALLCVVSLALYARRRKMIKREHKGKDWVEGPRSIEAIESDPELRKKMRRQEMLGDRFMSKLMPADDGPAHQRREAATVVKKQERKLTKAEQASAAVDAAIRADREGREVVVPTGLRTGDDDSNGSTSSPGSADQLTSPSGVNTTGTATPFKGSFSSFRSLLGSRQTKYPAHAQLLQLPSSVLTVSKDSSNASSSDPRSRTPSPEPGVKPFDEDGSSSSSNNNPAITATATAPQPHRMPDRHTGGPSRWSEPHPRGFRHFVALGYRPLEKDELEVRRGEVVVVERYYEDGWCRARREDPASLIVAGKVAMGAEVTSGGAAGAPQLFVLGRNVAVVERRERERREGKVVEEASGAAEDEKEKGDGKEKEKG